MDTNTNPASTTRSEQIAAWAAGALTRDFPPEIIQAAKLALTDVMGCAIGAADDECVRPVRKLVEHWRVPGNAQVFLGGRTNAAFAALVNGTMAHAMDYDDSHQMGAGHISCVCGMTALAMASEVNASEKDTLAAYITGFEVMARLAGGGPPGVGRSLHRRGLHPTSVFGRVAASLVASVLMRLTTRQLQLVLTVEAGLSNEAIAQALQLSPHTVKVHLWRLFRRFGVNNRLQLVRHAHQNGLI